jgi:hypothetical protein
VYTRTLLADETDQVVLTLSSGHSYTLKSTPYGQYIRSVAQLYVMLGTPTSSYKNVLAGGNRIKKTLSYSAPGNLAKSKNYLYAKFSTPSQSSAMGLFNPFYFKIHLVYKPCMEGQLKDPSYPYGFEECTISNFKYYSGYSNTLSNIYYYSGSPVSYASVVESDGDNFLNGRIDHEFTTYADAPATSILGDDLTNPPASSFTWRNGRETSTTFYKNSAGTYMPVKRILSSYREDSRKYKEIRSYLGNLKYNDPCKNSVDPLDTEMEAYNLSMFKIYASWVYQDTVRTQLFDQNGSVYQESMVISTYGNPTHALPTQLETINSKGEHEYQVNYYPTDLTTTGTDELARTKLVEKNMIAAPLKIEYKNGSSSLYTVYNGYKNFFTDVPLPVTKYVAKSTAQLELRTQVDQYSANGLVAQQAKAGDVKQSYIYDGYNSSPIASVVNAKENEIFHENFEFNGTWNGVVYDNSKAKTGRNSGRIDKATAGTLYYHSNKWLTVSFSAVTRYRYSVWVYSAGPSVAVNLFMKRAGEAGYYTYLSTTTGTQTNKWYLIEGEYDVPADVAQMNIRIDNNGGGSVWFDDVRLFPTLAQMITYTYDPQIGMTSQTDVNNNSTYYEYDGFNRLSLVKDQNQNILKRICYNFSGQPSLCEYNLNPIWQATGTTRCKPCPSNSAYITNILQNQELDINPQSSTYNTYRWTDAGTSTLCTVNADWQNTTTAIRCKKDASNQNTGEQEQEQKDLNPCSSTYNQTKWVVVGTNTTACPLPTQTVYAKITYSNVYNDGQITTASYFIKFYSDAACTISTSVNNLPINYKQVRTNCNGTSPITTNYSVTCTGSQYSLGTLQMAVDDGIHCWNYTYSVTTGTGYTAK